MDPATIKVIIQASQLLLKAVKKDHITKNLIKIQLKLDKLIQKSDQLILREIKSAYQAIDDARTTSNVETRDIRLKYAEDNLLKNTSLDSTLSTGGCQNTYLMALANYGLAFVCALRGDTQIAAIHLLRTYECDPRNARDELIPALFELLFEPECADTFEWYETELQAVQDQRYALHITGERVTASVLALAGVGLAIVTKRSAMGGGLFSKATEMWKGADTSQIRATAREKLAAQLADKLDSRCQEIATRLLSE